MAGRLNGTVPHVKKTLAEFFSQQPKFKQSYSEARKSNGGLSMNFWKNERYEVFENKAEKGDPMRGQSFQNFPWPLAQATITDSQQDTWALNITCTNVVPQKQGSGVVATLEAIARCQLSYEKLRSMGYNPERLEWMGLTGHEIVSEKVSADVKLNLDDLELVAKGNLKKFEAYILKNYTAQRKNEMIRGRIDACRFSRFGVSEQEFWEGK
jgi:hypothetical protein